MRAGRAATAEPGERATLGERVGQQETTGIKPTGAPGPATKPGSGVISSGNDCVKLLCSPAWNEGRKEVEGAKMNGNSAQQLYVSTFKMHIKSSPSASSSLGKSPSSAELRTPERSNSAGKSCRGSGGGRLVGLITLRREFSADGVQQVALVVASQGTMKPPGAGVAPPAKTSREKLALCF